MGFFIEKKIYYHDTDAGGVVYYANYLSFLEEARTELLVKKGIITRELAKEGVFFVVAHVDIDYKAPARYQDKIKVYAEITEVKNASMHFSQKAVLGELVLVTANTVLVCIDKDFKPRPLPGDLKKSILKSDHH